MIQSSIDYNSVSKDFLYNGFFSEYLIPSFKLPDSIDFFTIQLNEKSDLLEPLSFNMSRFSENGKRRIIHIPEFGAYINAVKYMNENDLIKEIILLSNDKHSFSPILNEDGELSRHEREYGKQIPLSDDEQDACVSTYLPNVIKKLNLARGAVGILKLDISSFYQSYYTHLTPCLKLGYENTMDAFKRFRANQSDPLIPACYSIYLDLDKKIRSMNGDRTNGLLTGITISRLLSEAILARIDEEIEKESIRFVRYVDDYEIFIYDFKEIPKTQNIISSILKKYFFSINYEKMEYVSFPYYVVKNLEDIYCKSMSKKMRSDDIVELFNTFFDLETEGVKGAVRYLIKSLDAVETDPNKTPFVNKTLYSDYLINVLTNEPRSLVKVCELIISSKNILRLGENDIALIESLLKKHIMDNNHLEALWLLYLRRILTTKRLKAELSKLIINSDNELAIIVLLEEYKSSLSAQMISQIIAKAKSWLLLYQLYYHDIISDDEFSTNSGIHHSLPLYKKLKRKKYSFYNKKVNQ